MRRIDLHCYPNTQRWIDCQGPYVEALAEYWNRDWKAKTEEEVVREFQSAGIEAVLVALDLRATINTVPCDNDYVAGMRDRHDCIIQAWGAVEPAMGQVAIDEAKHAIRDLKMLGFHFHPIMQHFSVDDQRYDPLSLPERRRWLIATPGCVCTPFGAPERAQGRDGKLRDYYK